MQVFYRFFLLMMFHLSSSISFSQLSYYEDLFHGQVIALGASSSDFFGSCTQSTGLSTNTNVKKLFFICYGIKGHNFIPTKRRFKLNGTEFSIDTLTKTTLYVDNINYVTPPADYFGQVIYCMDLTAYFPVIGSSITIDWLFDIGEQPVNCPSCTISAPRIVLFTDEPSLPLTACSILLNNKDNAPEITLNTTQLTCANMNSPVALGIHSDRLGGGNPTDGYNFWLNDVFAGKIVCGDKLETGETFAGNGAMGNFIYGNNSVSALTDDNIDSVFYGPHPDTTYADGLVTLNSYLLNNSINPLEFRFGFVGSSVNQHNVFISYTLAYSTPCQPQNVTVSNDTIICPNIPLQLHATGGTPNSHSTSGYEWLPQENLSCYDCADPIFTGDSSQLFTVRIWGSDSCSVVRPVMVHVRPKPTFSNLSLTASECGGANGAISAFTNSGVAYSLDSLSWQTSPNSASTFQNLASGNYNVFVTDTIGCIGDSSVFISEQLTVNAAFTSTPTAGAIPLQVNLSNQSSNYTNLEWFVDGTPQGNTLNNYTINQSGTVEIELVAWQNNPTCADTAQVYILAFDSLIISIPNVITPNNDGLNDVFSITSNLPINVSYSFTNRWGTVVASGSISNQQGTLVLWNPSATYSEGNYFYQLQFSSADVAIDQQIEQIGREKQGFLTLVK